MAYKIRKKTISKQEPSTMSSAAGSSRNIRRKMIWQYGCHWCSLSELIEWNYRNKVYYRELNER